MRRVLLSLGILALLCAPAYAGRNAGGAMVVHTVNEIEYCVGFDICNSPPLPQTCAELNTEITRDPNTETLIWVIAAFPQPSTSAVTAFQFGVYGDIPLDYFTAWSPCGSNALEIPDATWPAPGTGTAVAYGAPVYSQMFKMYWFAAMAPGQGSGLSTGTYPHGPMLAQFADDSTPPQIDNCYNFGEVRWGEPGWNQCPAPLVNGACCFQDGHCEDLLQDQCITQGGQYEGAGTFCSSFTCPPPPQACCFADGSCRDLQADECIGLGGSPQGPGSRCAGVTCPQPPQACCFADQSCRDLQADECARLGGSPQGPGSQCAGVTCPPAPPTGACCLVCAICEVLTQSACAAQGGVYQGDGTSCDPNPCTSSRPARTKAADEKAWHYGNWGWVRSTYAECTPDPSCNDTCAQAQAMACGDVISPASLVPDDQDWYTWSMNAGDALTCGTDGVNGGDNTDTYIELYANDCTTLLTQDDDGGPGVYSMISNFIAPYTGVYNLKVRGYDCLSTGAYKFFVNCGAPPPPPGNDLCSGAIELPRCSAGSLHGDTSTAHNDYDPSIPGPSCTGYSATGLDVVYFVNVQAGDILDLTYLQQNTDTSFYIVTDCSNVSGTCVAGADETVPPNPEVIRYIAAATGVYYIILDSYTAQSGGPWTLDYTISCPAPEACCFADGHCEMQLPEVCRQMAGTPQGAGTTCDYVVCLDTPTERTTWGHIKSTFR